MNAISIWDFQLFFWGFCLAALIWGLLRGRAGKPFWQRTSGFYEQVFAVTLIGLWAGFMFGYNVPWTEPAGPLVPALPLAGAITAIIYAIREGNARARQS